MLLWNPINIWQIEFVLIWIYSKGSENRFVVIQHFWCRKICKIVCRVPRKRVKSKFLYQDADVILFADKCIVVRSFVCRNYDKVLMETGKFSDNLRVTENGLVSGVDRAFKSSNSTNSTNSLGNRAFIKCYFQFQTFRTIIIIWTGTASTRPVGLPTQICTRPPPMLTRQCRSDVPFCQTLNY